jgi:hypothetical protein
MAAFVYDWANDGLMSAVCGGDYFPRGSLGETPREHQFRADWYSKALAALLEPSVWEMSQQAPTVEVYRFLWLRTFRHPISVRLTVASDGTGVLTFKETNGKGGYEPGTLIRNTAEGLSKEQTQWFCDRLDDVGFRKLKPGRNGTVGLDGARWIMEASKDGHYQIVDRWSPPPDDPIHTLGMMLMIDLAHFNLRNQEVY